MASNETAPNQCRRESDADLKHDQEVWLEDGNVVLACESTVFRVHRSILAAHCEVFKDMFAVHASPEDEKTYEGCPLVVVHDKPVDMRRFLKVIIYRNHYAKDITKLSLSELGSLLRLSTKYVFPSLRDKIVPFLEKLYPSRLDDYRSSHRKSLLPPDFNGISGVNLALQCDIPSILPAAYYICSKMAITVHHSGLSFIQPDTGFPELVEFSSTNFYHKSLWFRERMSNLLAIEIIEHILAGYRFCSTCTTGKPLFRAR